MNKKEEKPKKKFWFLRKKKDKHYASDTRCSYQIKEIKSDPCIYSSAPPMKSSSKDTHIPIFLMEEDISTTSSNEPNKKEE